MKNFISLLLVCIASLNVHAQHTNKAIHATVQGTGEPLVFIPGFTVPGEVWQPTVDSLKSRYECHVLTLAGFGGTQPIKFPWLPQVNEAIATYITDHKLENVTIIGHSLGGTVGIWLAAQPQLSIKELVIVDGLPGTGALMFPDFKPENLSYDSPYNNQQLAMNATDFEQMATVMAAGMSINPMAQEQIKNWILQADRETYVKGYTDYLKMDVRDELKNIQIPVTILAAGKPYREAMAKQTYASQYANLKDYKLVMATESAHFIMLDEPVWFMEQLQIALGN